MNRIKLTIAVALATLAASTPITLLTADPAWFPHAVALVGLVAGTSALLRWLRSPDFLVQFGQFGVFLATLVFLGLAWQADVQSDDGVIERLRILLVSGGEHIRTSIAPMPAHPGALWLLLALLGIVLITVDVLAVSLEQPAWSIAALATPYLVPAIALNGQLPWWHAGALVGGYCLLLATESAVTAVEPRNIVADSGGATATSGRFRLAALVATPVAIVAVVLGSVVPTGQFDQLFSGRASQTLELADPSIDLGDNLRRPANTVVLTYRTDAPNGTYLRLTALPIIDATGAKLGDVQVNSGALHTPELPGSTKIVRTEVAVENLASEYLPAPFAPSHLEAPGEWGWDPASLSVLALGPNRKNATQGLRYLVDSHLPQPTAEQLAAATAAGPPAGDERTAVVPADVPASIVALTKHVTQGRATAGQRALAIQDFLRDPATFTYSTAAPPGTGYEVLERFLLADRSGYCVHFATAMALMARIEGIPSRVAIGFLPGKRGTDDRWTVTAHDMHAWPELYFAELGWIAFEPTAAVAGTPEWTTPQPSTAPTTAPPTATSTPTPANQPSTAPTAPQETPETPIPSTPSARPATWPITLAWVLGIAAVLLAPCATRAVLRRRRLAAGRPPSERIMRAWAEVRATWVDGGGAWPDGSPRRVAALVSADLDAESAERLNRIALLVERSLYAEHLPDPGELTELVTALRRDLQRADKPLRRLAIALLPRSLWAGLVARTRSSSRSPSLDNAD